MGMAAGIDSDEFIVVAQTLKSRVVTNTLPGLRAAHIFQAG
ncbi:hypothetical protein SK36_03106 [Citrobacter sp. MGH106]|nr:hypothetical protein SK36_03106 [Citrobacter sp. MGH106]